MAVTQLTDLIVPPVFTQWVIDHLNDSNNLLNSGIITNNTQVADLTQAGTKVTVPFIKATAYKAQNWTDHTDIQTEKLSANSYLGQKFYQTIALSQTDLSTIISGAPTQEAIAQAMVESWNNSDEEALIKLLTGIFGVDDIKNAKLMDMTTVSPTSSEFSYAGFLAARTLMGDQNRKLTGIAVNEATNAMMDMENMKDSNPPVSADIAPLGTFHGMVVTVDHKIPLDVSDPKKPKANAYLFAQGAVSYKRQIIQTKTDDKVLTNGGESSVVQNSIGMMNVQGTGIKPGFTPADPNFPTIDELTQSDAWEVPEGKDINNVNVVAYTHTVDPMFAQGYIAAAKKKQDSNADPKDGQDPKGQDPKTEK